MAASAVDGDRERSLRGRRKVAPSGQFLGGAQSTVTQLSHNRNGASFEEAQHGLTQSAPKEIDNPVWNSLQHLITSLPGSASFYLTGYTLNCLERT